MKDELYVTSQGDTWDNIALAVYGEEAYADWLMQNNHWCLDTLVFPSGVVINAPALPESEEYEKETPNEEEMEPEEDDPYADGSDEDEEE